jgi:hypothetical protein
VPDELPARLRERHRTVGTYRKVLGRSLIELDLREPADPAHHLGHLTERESGYAPACWCRQRGESDPPWAAPLNSGVQAVFQQGLRHLASR